MSNEKNRTNLSGKDRYLRFSLGEEEYAVPLLTVREVIAKPDITPIPQTPNFFLGVINLRGQVITVLDLRVKLGIKPVNGPEVAVIICDVNSSSIGIMVDSVNSVIAPREEELSERPELKNQKAAEYITSVYRREKGLVLLLDISRLFSFEEQQLSAKVSHVPKAA